METNLITVTTPVCVCCALSSELIVDADAYKNYENGQPVQNAFPFLTSEVRELLISGTHDACWNQMFSDSDDKD